jgi:plastocyanin
LNRGVANVRSGEVEVETHNGVSITAVASSVDNSTGDTSVRESEQENERQHELEIRIAPSTAAIDAPVSFSIGSGSGVTAVRWSFGDGTTGTGITTTHTYTRAGEFSVSAEVTLTSGAIVRQQEDVHVLSAGGTVNNGPIDFSWSPLAPAPGQQVTFTASRTTGGGSFRWKFPGNVRANGAVAAFTFAAAGSYEVELELEHEGNTTLQATHAVTVGGTTQPPAGGNPSIDFTWTPAAPAAGQAVTFNATGGNGGTFVFKFPGGVRKSGSSVTFTFASAGSYEVELEQERQGSVTLHATHVVNVGGGNPAGGGGPAASTIDFTWSPTAPTAGQAITFTASGGNGGTFVFKFPGNVRKTGSVVTFTFAAAGSYEVELEQERQGSVTLHAAHTVVVGSTGNTPGTPGNGGNGGVTSVDFSWTPASPHAGQTVTLTATSDREPSAGSSFKWRMPDDSRPLGKTATYTFTTPGTYKIRVELEHAGVPSIEREKNIVIAP